jgi:cation transport regulator
MTPPREASGNTDPGRISDLPPDEMAPYNEEQRDAFVAAYNSALENYAGDRERALEIAHAAARGTPGER